MTVNLEPSQVNTVRPRLLQRVRGKICRRARENLCAGAGDVRVLALEPGWSFLDVPDAAELLGAVGGASATAVAREGLGAFHEACSRLGHAPGAAVAGPVGRTDLAHRGRDRRRFHGAAR